MLVATAPTRPSVRARAETRPRRRAVREELRWWLIRGCTSSYSLVRRCRNGQLALFVRPGEIGIRGIAGCDTGVTKSAQLAEPSALITSANWAGCAGRS